MNAERIAEDIIDDATPETVAERIALAQAAATLAVAQALGRIVTAIEVVGDATGVIESLDNVTSQLAEIDKTMYRGGVQVSIPDHVVVLKA